MNRVLACTLCGAVMKEGHPGSPFTSVDKRTKRAVRAAVFAAKAAVL